jgi:hypothetical protein
MLPRANYNPFGVKLVGTPGMVRTRRGQFQYLLTKATVALGESAKIVEDGENVAKQLRLVREVIDVRSLHFDQLLQRDLDDRRVAHHLIPYLLDRRGDVPPFFPPVLAMLLPVRPGDSGLRRPMRQYPAQTHQGSVIDHGAHWQEATYGTALRVRHLLDNDGNRQSRFPVAELAWNSDECELIVLDGQHRAMALLALYREMTDSWPAEGERVRMFYRSMLHRLRSELADAAAAHWRMDLPVSICLPIGDSEQLLGDPLQTARKLFVDVNQSARSMSSTRALLLSDRVLKGAFLREFLELLRAPDSPLPLYAVDYDEPANFKKAHIRWSTATELLCLESAIEITCFNPGGIGHNVLGALTFKDTTESKIASLFDTIGEAAQIDLDEFLRDVVEDSVPNTRGGSRLELVCDSEDLRTQLARQFAETWGRALQQLLSSVLPVPIHIAALADLKKELEGSDGPYARLLREAVFDGVGLFGVLAAAAEDDAQRGKREEPAADKTELERAWAEIKATEKAHLHRIAEKFAGDSGLSPAALWSPAKTIFAQSTTHAWQLGLVLTLTAVHHVFSEDDAAPLDVAQWLTTALNSAMRLPSPNGRDRRFALLRNADAGPSPFNMLGKLDGPLAVHFRYFWLEMALHCEPNLWDVWPAAGHREAVANQARLARAKYREYLIGEHIKELKKIHGSKDTDVARTATKAMTRRLQESLKYWFGITDIEFNRWLIEIDGNIAAEQG